MAARAAGRGGRPPRPDQPLRWPSRRPRRACRRRRSSASICGAKSSMTSCRISSADARNSSSRRSCSAGASLPWWLPRSAALARAGRYRGDDVGEQGNVVRLEGFGQQGRLVPFVEQVVDRLQVIEQLLRGCVGLWLSMVVHFRYAAGDGPVEDSPAPGRSGIYPVPPGGSPAPRPPVRPPAKVRDEAGASRVRLISRSRWFPGARPGPGRRAPRRLPRPGCEE